MSVGETASVLQSIKVMKLFTAMMNPKSSTLRRTAQARIGHEKRRDAKNYTPGKGWKIRENYATVKSKAYRRIKRQ